MKRKHIAAIASASAFALFGGGAFTAQTLMTSRIEKRINGELPKASGVTASIPFVDMPQNLTSDSIKSAKISIGSYSLKGSKTESSIAISANNISKSQPTLVGSLNVTATIPAATIIKSAEFENAKIVGNALQVSVGASGLGKALLTPKFSDNTIYFQLESISILGNPIPSSALPTDIQNQIKNKSIREVNVPKGLKLKSVSLSSKGLSVNLQGSNIQLGKLGSSL